MGRPLLLLDAARSYHQDSEDRLTELFASALSAHPGFCGALHDKLGLPRGDQYRITTQHRISPECRLDMRIEARRADGAITSVVYSEHKIDGYWFSEGQVDRERKGLKAEHAADKRLICVISHDQLATLRASEPNAATTTANTDFDEAFSWRQIASLAREAGRAWPAPWGGPGWSDRALEPTAPAAQRVLVEFLAYLEEDEVPEAISADDLLAFRLADIVQTKVDTMLTLAAKHVQAFHVTDAVYSDEEGSSMGVTLTCIDFDLPGGHWLAEDEYSGLSAAIATTNAQVPRGEEEPHVYAGLYIADDDHAKTAQADREWMAAAATHGLEALAYESGLWIVGTRLLSEFVDAGPTLETQAAALGRWLADTLTGAAALSPPHDDAASGTGSRRRSRPRKRT